MSASYPQRRPITSTTWVRWWELAVSFMRSMAASAVFNAVSTLWPCRYPHVVVYGGREAHYRHPALFEPQPAGQASLPVDLDQPIHACLLQPADRAFLSFRRRELRRACRPEHRPAPVQDSAHRAVAQTEEAALQPPVAGQYSHDLPTPEKGRARHRPHRRVLMPGASPRSSVPLSLRP
jgi:hypothetical protein